jgi:polyhydroxyalkanoate synthesis repressor PhaR
VIANPDKPVIIKKYATRRLYNTTTHTITTLDGVADLVRQGTDLAIHENKSGKDITRSVLLHIIFERESKAEENLLPIAFLRQLIRFYGDSRQMQMLVLFFLDVSISSFIREQEKLRAQSSGFAPFTALEEVARQNMEVFRQTVAMLKPSVSSDAARNSR